MLTAVDSSNHSGLMVRKGVLCTEHMHMLFGDRPLPCEIICDNFWEFAAGCMLYNHDADFQRSLQLRRDEHPCGGSEYSRLYITLYKDNTTTLYFSASVHYDRHWMLTMIHLTCKAGKAWFDFCALTLTGRPAVLRAGCVRSGAEVGWC